MSQASTPTMSVRLVQPKNRTPISLTSAVLKETFSVVSPDADWNIRLTSVRLVVTHPLRSSVVRPVQERNKPLKVVAADTSKVSTPVMLVNPEQP